MDKIKDFQELTLDEKSIDLLSKALTEYAFRSGPIEDMHANNQLSQDDMMQLNKYMVNKMAGLLSMIAQKEWLKIDKVMGFYARLASEWDTAEPDTKDFYI